MAHAGGSRYGDRYGYLSFAAVAHDIDERFFALSLFKIGRVYRVYDLISGTDESVVLNGDVGRSAVDDSLHRSAL